MRLKRAVRVGLGFAAAAATFVAVTAAPLAILDHPPTRTWLAIVRTAWSDVILLGWLYGWAVMLTTVFGIPAWLILRWRRWTGWLAHAAAGALAADTGLASLYAAWQLPTDAWGLFALWLAAGGAGGGLMFCLVVPSDSWRGTGRATEELGFTS